MPSKPKRGKGAKKRLAARKQIQQSHQEQDQQRRILIDRILPQTAVEGPLSDDHLQDIGERIPDWPRSRHDQARLIMEEVWDDSDDPDEYARERLLRTVLALSPNNSEAWMFLADCAPTDSDALECCNYAIKGEREFLGERFQQLAGQFWLAHETRLFMHAMHVRADILDRLGRNEEAITGLQELLSLNPHDNQGVRYRLVGLLLLHRREAEAQALIDSFQDEGGCVWPYARLILAFRNREDDATLMKRFNDAFESNPWMLSFLTGALELPDGWPEFYQPGEKSEADTMVFNLMRAWTATPGLAAWIRKAISSNLIKLPQQEHALSIQEQTMDAGLVPQDKDIIWEVDCRKERIEGEVMISLFIVSRDEGIVPGNEFFDKTPKPAEVFEVILTAITQPDDGSDPIRPGTIVFAGKTMCRNLKKRLERIGIRSEHGPTPAIDQFAEFAKAMTGSDEQFDSLDPAEVDQFDELVWQIGALELPSQIESEGEIVRPYMILVVDRKSELIFNFELVTEIPDGDAILGVIRKAIFTSPADKPMRPVLIQFSSADQMLSVRDTLEDWGIPCEVAKSLKSLNTAIKEMRSRFGDEESPLAPLTETPGVQFSDLESFYRAADDFFVAAPWLKTPGDQQFLLTSLTDGTKCYLSVMGQMGSLLGLSIYTSVVDLRNMFSGNFKTSRNDGNIWSVSFDEQHLLSLADIRLIEDHGWKISAPEAFPTILSARDGIPESITSRDDLLQITLCIAAINNATLPITSPQEFDVQTGPTDKHTVRIEPFDDY